MKTSLRNILLVVIIFATQSLTTNGQTYISGFISANTTWDLAGSPYIVNGNALLSNGYTLTINPGVVVKFDSLKALQIDGKLIAIGTPQNRITFTSNRPTPHVGDWAVIHFADQSENAIFDNIGNYISGSIMKFCDVFYGGGIGDGEINIESSSPYFSHCNIMNSSASGICGMNVVFEIDSSAIKNCNDYGIAITNPNLDTCCFKINADTIENNLKGGILLNSGNQDIGIYPKHITNNYFISNGINGEVGAIDATNCDFNNLLISDNYFFNNASLHSIIGFDQLKNDTIKCNRFIKNQANEGCIFLENSDGMIFDNIFEENSGNCAVIWTMFSNLSFSNNYIANNSSGSIYGNCYFYIYEPTNTLITPNFYIDHNTFFNNTGISTIQIRASSSGNSNLNFLFMKYNNFTNPNIQYEFYNSSFYGNPNIHAENNYWGSTNTQHIDSVIYDYFDYANQSVVYYMPILTSPIAIDTSCPPPIEIHVNYQEINNNISIFPNPAHNYLNLTLPKNNPNTEIKIYSLLGELQFMSTVKNQNSVVDISELTKGIYIIEIASGNNITRSKFIKQ